MLADGEPAWLVAWRERDRQPEPAPPTVLPAPTPRISFQKVSAADWQGLIIPSRWDYDGCKRREPVVDIDQRPHRVVRKVGWQRCMKCRRPFFSEDVVRLRLCGGSTGSNGCRTDGDRFT